MTSAAKVSVDIHGVGQTDMPRRSSLGAVLKRPEFGAVMATVLVYLFFAIATGGNGFVSVDGTAGWLNTAAELGIIAIPIGLLMIAGEFDLSVGSVVGAASITVAIGTTLFGLPDWMMIIVALVMGVAIGLFNGILTVRTGLPSFIVTLAASFAVGGLSLGFARLLSNTTTVSTTISAPVQGLFAGTWGLANISILWWVAVTLLAGWVLARTAFGNWIFATGGNAVAARGVGVPTAFVKVVLFAVTGAAAALVGMRGGRSLIDYILISISYRGYESS